MFKSKKPNTKSINKVANYLEVNVSDIVRYINSKEYNFEYYINFRKRNFEACIIEKEFFEELMKVFSYRKKDTEDIDTLEENMEKVKEKNEKGKFYRTKEAKCHIKKEFENNGPFYMTELDDDLSDKRTEYRKWYEKKRKEKKMRIEEKLEGTGISVKLDKEGRPLYYRERGKWIPHKEARKAMRKNDEDDDDLEDEEEDKGGVFEPGDDLPF